MVISALMTCSVSIILPRHRLSDINSVLPLVWFWPYNGWRTPEDAVGHSGEITTSQPLLFTSSVTFPEGAKNSKCKHPFVVFEKYIMERLAAF